MNDRNHDHFREATKKVDYIDRNEAIEAIKNDALDLVYYGKKEAIECLESVPAADGRPVVYGEWEEISCADWYGWFTDEWERIQKAAREVALHDHNGNNCRL